MTGHAGDTHLRLGRQEASDAVSDLGWRYVLGALRSCVPVGSLTQAAEVAARVVAVCESAAEDHLHLDIRSDRVVLSLSSPAIAAVSARDVVLAGRISAAANDLGLGTEPERDGGSVQALEIAIDALDIASVRPFWRAVLGYVDEAGSDELGGLVDPMAQGPAVWFQQMDAPRPQRNRIHIDISVPHDRATHRIQAAVAAGGTIVSDRAAPAFWVLADPEGNEACISTWQGRDG